MKKSVFAVLCLLCLACAVQAETIKMKSGEFISGSILSQTEYTLNLATSFGTITLNQREIEQILPDKHRIILKGGTQLVGVILDLDEFNLKLQTDDGATVNVDMPQIVSIEAYDYDRGQNAQKEFVEKTQQVQQAKEEAKQAAAAKGAAPVVEAAGGLTFDSDIDQVFAAQKATVVNGSVVTPSATVTQAAPKLLTDEEAFIKGVKTGAVSQTDFAKAAKEELNKKKVVQPAVKTTDKPREKDFSKYFAIQAGAMPLDLKLDNSARDDYDAQDDSIDVGGTSAAVSSKFLWRVKESNLWAGPVLGIANIANASFADKDPAVQAANAADMSAGREPSYPDPTVRTSGQILTLGAAANYYLNPNSRFVFYVTASAMYEMLTLNYRGEMQSNSIKSNGFAGGAGVGVETWVDDIMLGLEARQVFAQRSGELKNSAASNTVIQAQFSWKF
ncbi:outer membrane beta-barrel protein [Candidatus Avelusimicrobium fimicolum]|uniref:outer membrane beta-barrel protein n=1 Tax=Candidatus Avelusimicrobium fimicolum TaxID=3416216 RepID=UPI003D0C3370